MDLDQTDPLDARPAAATALTPRQKAAVIVSLALAEGAELPLQDMPRALQEVLARQIAALGPVGEGALAAVVAEFGAALGARVTLPSGSRAALRLLDGRVDPEALAALRGPGVEPDPWERVGRAGSDALLPVIEREAVEMAAMILSRLPTERAAEILGRLPGPRARRIAFAVSRIGAIDPALARRIGRALADELAARPAEAFEGGPERRVGAILNAAPSRTRDEVLEGLREDDAAFADAVRRSIFTFADIEGRLDAADAGAVMRAVDDATQAAALAAAVAAGLSGSVEHLLGAMPKRMAERVREGMDGWSGSPEEGEAAMAAVAETIRRLESEGALTLRPPAD